MTLPVQEFVTDLKIGRLYLRELDISNCLATVTITSNAFHLRPARLFVNGAPASTVIGLDLGVRLIDFKTYSPFNSVKRERRTVEEYHLTPIKRTESDEDFPAWALIHNGEGKTVRWTDLQLPLYRLAMERRYPGAKIHTAYATLGKTKVDVNFDPWPALEGPLLDSARACALGIIESVRARTFWPPKEKPQYDDFEALFFGDVLTAVDASVIAKE